jgi:hypothetical protein
MIVGFLMFIFFALAGTLPFFFIKTLVKWLDRRNDLWKKLFVLLLLPDSWVPRRVPMLHHRLFLETMSRCIWTLMRLLKR